jgi:uncharacterized repeat protein (TIGR01451 family)
MLVSMSQKRAIKPLSMAQHSHKLGEESDEEVIGKDEFCVKGYDEHSSSKHQGGFMKNISRYFESMCLGIVILTTLFGVVQAEDPYRVVIVGDAPPHSSSVVVGAGESVDMRVLVLNVTDPVVAGSSLYLNYDPQIVSGVFCVKSIYKEHNNCKEVQPGRYLFEGYDTFGKYSGDVEVAVLRLTTNVSAPVGSSSTLTLSGQRLGTFLGTPVWGPFWQVIETPLESGMLTIGGQEPSPGIKVNKSVNPTSGLPSTNATFNITVQNIGGVTLNNVTVVDSLPEGMSYVSADKPPENVTGRVVTWDDVGSLLSNDTPVSIKMIAHADRGTSGNLTNSVEASGVAEPGGRIAANATANFAVIELSSPGIQVNKSANPMSGLPSTNATFNITVRNTGKVTLHNVTIVDSLPEGMSYVSADKPPENITERIVTWYIGSLLSNDTPVSIKMVAHMDRCASGNLVNSVEAIGRAGPEDEVTANASANFAVIKAGLQVKKMVFPEVAGVMYPVTFMIKVKNTENSTLNNVTLTDTLPAGLIYLSSSPHGTVTRGGKVFWDLLVLRPQESRLFRLVAKVGFRAGRLLRNEAFAIGSTVSGSNVTDYASAVVKVDRELNMAYIAG